MIVIEEPLAHDDFADELFLIGAKPADRPSKTGSEAQMRHLYERSLDEEGKSILGLTSDDYLRGVMPHADKRDKELPLFHSYSKEYDAELLGSIRTFQKYPQLARDMILDACGQFIPKEVAETRAATFEMVFRYPDATRIELFHRIPAEGKTFEDAAKYVLEIADEIYFTDVRKQAKARAERFLDKRDPNNLFYFQALFYRISDVWNQSISFLPYKSETFPDVLTFGVTKEFDKMYELAKWTFFGTLPVYLQKPGIILHQDNEPMDWKRSASHDFNHARLIKRGFRQEYLSDNRLVKTTLLLNHLCESGKALKLFDKAINELHSTNRKIAGILFFYQTHENGLVRPEYLGDLPLTFQHDGKYLKLRLYNKKDMGGEFTEEDFSIMSSDPTSRPNVVYLESELDGMIVDYNRFWRRFNSLENS